MLIALFLETWLLMLVHNVYDCQEDLPLSGKLIWETTMLQRGVDVLPHEMFNLVDNFFKN